jgi:hypothetical protein
VCWNDLEFCNVSKDQEIRHHSKGFQHSDSSIKVKALPFSMQVLGNLSFEQGHALHLTSVFNQLVQKQTITSITKLNKLERA